MMQQLLKVTLLAVVSLTWAHQPHIYDKNTKTLTVKADDDVIKMIVMGDWGGIPVWPYYTPFESVTAKRMITVANEEDTKYVLALGDNFYENGVVNEYDPRFQHTFENVFSDLQFNKIPWFVLAGNHDHYGNVTGEIAYSQHSMRWVFPELWYSIELQNPTVSATIVMIDTVTLCGNTNQYEVGSKPNGKINIAEAEMQLQFIEQKLKSSKDKYLLVAGHFPVWSVAEHGPTQCLLEKLKPLLEKYNATAYFCGHDHNLQHIKENNSTVEYFLTGAVDVVDPSTAHLDDIPKDSLKFHWAHITGLGGFATVDMDPKQMTVRFISATGNSLYKHSVPSRH